MKNEKSFSVYDFERELHKIQAQKYLEHLIEKGAKAELTEKKGKRTLDQNALFHIWIKVFSEYIGEHALEDVKRDVKRHLLGQETKTSAITGETILVDYSTAKMDTAQMSAFMDKFKQWAMADYGCYLPYWKDAGYEDLIFK